jgi:hypothetical protein
MYMDGKGRGRGQCVCLLIVVESKNRFLNRLPPSFSFAQTELIGCGEQLIVVLTAAMPLNIYLSNLL